MTDSFDMVAFIRALRKERPNEDIFIEKSNNKRIAIRNNDDIADICGMVVIIREARDIAINPDHIISIISKGDL